VTVNGLIIPQQVILPASLGLGASYAVDSAPFWPGHKWLVASDLLFTASSANAVGVESVLAQKIQPVGTDDTVGVRLGSELETIPGRLRLRLGDLLRAVELPRRRRAGCTVTGGIRSARVAHRVSGANTTGVSPRLLTQQGTI
jgi:hypothetical protein